MILSGEDQRVKIPYLIKPTGERIALVVRDYVPYLANNDSGKITTPSTQQRLILRPTQTSQMSPGKGRKSNPNH